jgi:hypothetical protein
MKTTLTAVSALLLGMSPLSAALILPGTLDIDFRDSSWAGATANQSFTAGDITAKAYAFSLLGSPLSARLGQNATDGLGVDRRGGLLPGVDDPNEIDFNERLEITFANGSGTSLAGIWFTQLLLDDLGLLPGNQTESAIVKLTFLDDSTFEFNVDGAEANGNFFLDFGVNRNVAKIDFKSSGISDDSVAGVAVPEGGSTLAILGMAMASLTFWQRRSAK